MDVLFDAVKEFFDVPEHLRQLTTYLVEHRTVSLRALDWLVTNYAKKHNTAYLFTEATGDTRIFNVHLEYKSQLKSFSKAMFDPFKRGPRVQFADANGKVFETTLGQLNFFKWAIRYHVARYAEDHIEAIDADMIASLPAAATPRVPSTSCAPTPSSHTRPPAVRIRVTFR